MISTYIRLKGLSPKTAKSKSVYPPKFKVFSKEIIYDLEFESATEGPKLFILKNTQILIFDIYIYLQQVRFIIAGRTGTVISTRPSNTSASRRLA